MNICTGDMGTVAAKKYDLEAWIPGADQYKEIVSCSNCTDYQANRLGIRYGQPGHPNQPIVHTLNSTAVATSRALVAIMEQGQLEDGAWPFQTCCNLSWVVNRFSSLADGVESYQMRRANPLRVQAFEAGSSMAQEFRFSKPLKGQ